MEITVNDRKKDEICEKVIQNNKYFRLLKRLAQISLPFFVICAAAYCLTNFLIPGWGESVVNGVPTKDTIPIISWTVLYLFFGFFARLCFHLFLGNRISKDLTERTDEKLTIYDTEIFYSFRTRYVTAPDSRIVVAIPFQSITKIDIDPNTEKIVLGGEFRSNIVNQRDMTRKSPYSKGSTTLSEFVIFDYFEPELKKYVSQENQTRITTKNDLIRVDFGFSQERAIPLILSDPKAGISNNCLIFGSPGSGTTYTLQLLAMRLFQAGSKICIISTEKGFIHKFLCQHLDGAYTQLGAPSNACINIMDLCTELPSIRHWEESLSENAFPLLDVKAKKLITFYSLLTTFTPIQERMLESAIYETYKRFGFKLHYETPEDARKAILNCHIPTLHDLNDTFSRLSKNPFTEEFRIITEKLTSVYLGCFNGQTNITLDNPLTVLDISELPDKIRSAAAFAAMDLVQSVYQESRNNHNTIFFEQIERLTDTRGSDLSASYVLDLFHTIRSTNSSIVATVMDASGFYIRIGDTVTKRFADCSQYHIVLRQNQHEAQLLSEFLGLDSNTAIKLTTLGKRWALFHDKGGSVDTIRILASSQEDDVLDSDPLNVVIENR